MNKFCKTGMYFKTAFVTISLLLLLSFQSVLAAEPITVCSQTDFSGVTASLGILQNKVVEMFVRDLNAAGGIKGRPIKLIVQDNGSDPSRAIGIAKMFKDQYKCKAMLADLTSTVGLALKSFADANKIPMVGACTQTDKATATNQKAWYFIIQSSSTVNVGACLARMAKLGYTKIAYEGTTLGWGTDMLATAKALAPQYGIEIIHVLENEPKTKDLSIQVKKMKDSGAQAVFVVDYEAETATLARAMTALGWKPYVMNASDANIFATIALGDPQLYEGWETVSLADPSKPLVQKIWKQASAYIGKPVDEDAKAVRAYDQIAVFVEALKAAKNIDNSESIRDAFYNINPNWERAIGKIGSKGGYTTAINRLIDVNDMIVLHITNGKPVTVR